MSTNILTAFLDRLSALVLSPVLPVIYPGIPDSPPSSGMWIEASYFPQQPEDLVWDNDSQLRITGHFLVAVYFRPGTGPSQSSLVSASRVADEVIAHFRKGQPLGPVRVLKSAWQNPAVNKKGKSSVPVVVPYMGIVQVVPEGALVDDQGNYIVDDQGNYITL